jgi:outer membrane protein assembly factor BamB
MDGFHVLAPGNGEKIADDHRLEKGPAFDSPLEKTDSTDDWPTYRRDNARSGATDTKAKGGIKSVWKTPLKGKISPPILARGKVFVSIVDQHIVAALDAASGKQLWDFQAGARVDSPPTFHRGHLVFGSRDGRLYCLRASDGELVWKLRAAPLTRHLVAYDQVESVWPLHGSVLVKNGLAYVAAGRSSFLDGGIRVLALDVATGVIKHKNVLHDKVIIPGAKSGSTSKYMIQGAVPDIMVAGDGNIYMGQLMLGNDLKVKPVKPANRLGTLETPLRLCTTSGFLDDTYFNRTFWMYAKRWPGYSLATQGPKSGQILVFDKTTTYSAKVFDQRLPKHQKKGPYRSGFFKPGSGYLLLAEDNSSEPKLESKVPGAEGERPDHVRTQQPKWSKRFPIRIRAMVKAGSLLFIAGPPDAEYGPGLVDALAGRRGGMLWTISAADGEKKADLKLDAPPVFDGLITANGRLFMSDTAGDLHCFGGE